MYRLTPEEQKIINQPSREDKGKVRIGNILLLVIIFVSMVLIMNYCVRTIGKIERDAESIIEAEY